MKGKKLLALGLSGLMAVGSLTACGSSESQSGAQSEGMTAAAESSAESQAADGGLSDTAASEDSAQTGESGESSDATYNVTWDDLVDVNVMYLAGATIPSGLQEVEDAINAITEEKISVHVNLQMVEMGSYIQQVSLIMSSSEAVDLLMSFPGGAASFASMQNQNQLMDLTDLMSEYGQPILDTVGQYINATTVNGSIYGVPVYRNYDSWGWVVMRTDVLEDLGLLEQAENITSLSDLEAILEAVHSSDKWSYLSGIASAAGNGDIAYIGNSFIRQTPDGENIIYDGLGSEIVTVDATGEDPEVKLAAALPEYKELYDTIHSWYEKGYVYLDAATSTDAALDLIKSDALFATIQSGELGFEVTAENMAGRDLTCVQLIDTPTTTGTVTGFTWVVPNSAAEPEAAVTFMSMMYTSPEINNLFAWGIEGRDYIVEDGVAKYPDGDSNVPYHSDDYMTGNQFLVTPWEGNDPDIRQKALEAVENSAVSAYLGFTCDTNSISTEISAVSNVVAEFSSQIETGVAAPEVLDQYIERMESNGVQKIIDEYQRQLDEWIAQNQ